jgi:hypothetical protein
LLRMPIGFAAAPVVAWNAMRVLNLDASRKSR